MRQSKVLFSRFIFGFIPCVVLVVFVVITIRKMIVMTATNIQITTVQPVLRPLRAGVGPGSWALGRAGARRDESLQLIGSNFFTFIVTARSNSRDLSLCRTDLPPGAVLVQLHIHYHIQYFIIKFYVPLHSRVASLKMVGSRF